MDGPRAAPARSTQLLRAPGPVPPDLLSWRSLRRLRRNNQMFKNLTVKTRLQIGFAAVSGLFLLILLASGMGISRLAQDVQRINETTLPNVLLVDEMDLSRSDVQQFLTDVSATHDPDGFGAAEAAAQRFLKAVETFKQAYQREGNAGGIQEIEVI